MAMVTHTSGEGLAEALPTKQCSASALTASHAVRIISCGGLQTRRGRLSSSGRQDRVCVQRLPALVGIPARTLRRAWTTSAAETLWHCIMGRLMDSLLERQAFLARKKNRPGTVPSVTQNEPGYPSMCHMWGNSKSSSGTHARA